MLLHGAFSLRANKRWRRLFLLLFVRNITIRETKRPVAVGVLSRTIRAHNGALDNARSISLCSFVLKADALSLQSAFLVYIKRPKYRQSNSFADRTVIKIRRHTLANIKSANCLGSLSYKNTSFKLKRIFLYKMLSLRNRKDWSTPILSVPER